MSHVGTKNCDWNELMTHNYFLKLNQLFFYWYTNSLCPCFTNGISFSLVSLLGGTQSITNPMNIVGVNAFPPTSITMNFYKVIIDVVVVDLDTEECVQKKSIRNIKFVSFIRLICSYKSHSIIMEMTEKFIEKQVYCLGLLAPHTYSFYFAISFNYLWVFISIDWMNRVHRRHWILYFSFFHFYLQQHSIHENLAVFFMRTFPLLFVLKLIVALLLRIEKGKKAVIARYYFCMNLFRSS